MLTRLWMWLMTRMGRDSRGLFLFYDGRKWRTVDGLETLRGFFLLTDFDWDETPEMLKQPLATVQVATSKRMADAVRSVFKIKTAADGGLTETECMNLFWTFRNYCDNVKKNTSLYPMSPDSTDSNQLDILEIPPNPSLVSGSIPKEQSPEHVGSLVVPMSASTMK